MKSIISIFLILTSIVTIIILSSCAVPLPSYSTVNFPWTGKMQNEERDNNLLAKKIYKMINEKYTDSVDVLVLSENFHILVVGEAKTLIIKNEISDMISKFPNVHEVHNFITIAPKPNYVTNSSINRKVKKRIASEENLSQENIRSITINSEVYILGTIYPYEKVNMVSLINGIYSIYGVKKVIDLTQVNKIDELPN